MKAIYGIAELCTDKKTDSYIHINNFGMYDDAYSEIDTFRPNGREDYQLIIVLKGTCKFTVKSNEFTLGEKGCVIYPPK